MVDMHDANTPAVLNAVENMMFACVPLSCKQDTVPPTTLDVTVMLSWDVKLLPSTSMPAATIAPFTLGNPV